MKQVLIQQKEVEEDEAKIRHKDSQFNSITDDANDALDDSDDDDIHEFTDTVYKFDDEVDEEEERMLDTFMLKNAGQQLTLTELIVNKIKGKNEQVSSEARPLPKMDNTIIELYKGVGKYMTKLTSGKVPKAFKHIPSLEVWEDVLYLTEPEKWSAKAMYEATRLFSSNFGAKKAQRFYSLVLLPRIREDIRTNKSLHFYRYQALKKSLYKIAAFNKGILFPLCESGTCSLREAVIIGSIMEKVSIPSLHSSAAIMKLAEMEYCGTTSYFIKLLLDKKYALPYQVLDAVVAHFMRFLDDTRIMPVIWHQCLLTFVQRYKTELTKEDKDNLERLIQYQKHYLVTNEIRRELKNSRNRGEKEDPMSIAFSSVINKAIEEDRFDFPDVPMEEE